MPRADAPTPGSQWAAASRGAPRSPAADATAPLMGGVDRSVECVTAGGLPVPAVMAQPVWRAPAAVPTTLPAPAVVMATGIGPVFTAPGVIVPMAPVVAAVACDCTPRCKSPIVHHRLMERARHNGANLRQQRVVDADKRRKERQRVSLLVILGYVGWYGSQCEIYCSECAEPIFQSCPGLEGCPAPTHTDPAGFPMVDGRCAGEGGAPWPPVSNDGIWVTSPVMCLTESPGMTAAVIFVGGFINVSSHAVMSAIFISLVTARPVVI